MEGAASAAPSPVGVSRTPSGMVIEYFLDPKRFYKVNGVEVVSVTQALDVLDKPALPWWGMKVGAAALLALEGRGQIELAEWAKNVGFEVSDKDDIVDALISIVSANKLSTNHVRDRGGERGQSAHDALEAWGVSGVLPEPSDYTFEEEGYVRGLRNALEALPMEVEAQEVMVGSEAFGYAGRYDLRARVLEDSTVVTKVYPKRKPLVTTIPASRILLDLKTSKDIYENHGIQLAAYEHASIEGGYGPTDYRVVLHVGPDGSYQLRRARHTIAEFAPIVGAYHAVARAKELIKP